MHDRTLRIPSPVRLAAMTDHEQRGWLCAELIDTFNARDRLRLLALKERPIRRGADLRDTHRPEEQS
jgi:hypothetical protein